jgi:RNA polymerase sigma factor for flagellar operon FliA
MDPLQRFNAFRRMARRIGQGFAMRAPEALRDDLLAAAARGLWSSALRFRALDDEQFERVAMVRVRGAIRDELRSADVLSRHGRLRVNRGLDPETVKVSLDELGDGHGLATSDDASPAEQVEQRQRNALLFAKLAELPEREARILRSHYFEDVPLRVIAAAMQVSEARVSQMHARALNRLNAWMTGTAVVPRAGSRKPGAKKYRSRKKPI